MTFTLAWWWMLVLLPLLWLVRFLPAVRPGVAGVFYPFDRSRLGASGQQAHRATMALLLLAWACLVAAIARPQLVSHSQVDNQMARNLVLAVDISESMLEQDMVLGRQRVSRIEALKVALQEFVHKRSSDQLGLLVFADNAYVQSPLSFDNDAIVSLIEQLRVGLAGKRTSIGDALVLAVKVIDNNPLAKADNSSIILLSDGTNTWGRVSPRAALELAKNRSYKVYTIGFGSARSGGLDERTLKGIAAGTGGSYYRATNTEELRKVYSHLDQLNRVEIVSYSYTSAREMYYLPLLGAIAAIICALVSYHFSYVQRKIEGEPKRRET